MPTLSFPRRNVTPEMYPLWPSNRGGNPGLLTANSANHANERGDVIHRSDKCEERSNAAICRSCPRISANVAQAARQEGHRIVSRAARQTKSRIVSQPGRGAGSCLSEGRPHVPVMAGNCSAPLLRHGLQGPSSHLSGSEYVPYSDVPLERSAQYVFADVHQTNAPPITAPTATNR